MLCPQFSVFRTKHSAVRLIHSETAHAEITYRFSQMRSKVFLPGFTVVYLMTLCVTVSICIDAARFLRIVVRRSDARGLCRRYRRAAVYPIAWHVIIESVADNGVKLRPAVPIWVDEMVYRFFRNRALSEILRQRFHLPFCLSAERDGSGARLVRVAWSLWFGSL